MSYSLDLAMDNVLIVSKFIYRGYQNREIYIKSRKRLDLENAWGVLRYGVLVCQDCKLVHIAIESQRKQHVSKQNGNFQTFFRQKFTFFDFHLKITDNIFDIFWGD